MNCPRVLIAGIGNIFFGDDAFGVEVVRRLQQQRLPQGVAAIDFGIRGFDLAYAISGNYDAVILIDVISTGRPAGTLVVLEPEVEALEECDPEPSLEAHSLDPMRVLQYVVALGGPMPKLRLIGCQPASFGSAEQPQMSLSPAVSKAVDEAAALVYSVLGDMLAELRQQTVIQ
jgi:hydrogenase maturation protease